MDLIGRTLRLFAALAIEPRLTEKSKRSWEGFFLLMITLNRSSQLRFFPSSFFSVRVCVYLLGFACIRGRTRKQVDAQLDIFFSLEREGIDMSGAE